jgi:hypothetical protein
LTCRNPNYKVLDSFYHKIRCGLALEYDSRHPENKIAGCKSDKKEYTFENDIFFPPNTFIAGSNSTVPDMFPIKSISSIRANLGGVKCEDKWASL